MSEAWNESTQCTWHWQVEAYDVSKWVSAGIKGRLWNTSSSFLSSGDICFWSVSTMSVVKRFRRCADSCQCFLTPDDTHDLCVMCLSEEHARSVLEGMAHCELFFGKAPLLFVPFLERIGAIICPPTARVQPLLRQRGDWDRVNRRWSLLTSLREELKSRARQRLTRVNCWRKMYSVLHLLIQQEVLCRYFWAFSACLPRVWRAVGSYEACYC